MPDPFKDLEQDITHLLTAAAKNAAANGAEATAADPARHSRRRKRRPGAPLGNQNAFKHGLYSRKVTQQQLDALLDARKSSYLNGEIDILRLQIADLHAQPGDNFDRLMRAITVLARVVRIDDRVRSGP